VAGNFPIRNDLTASNGTVNFNGASQPSPIMPYKTRAALTGSGRLKPSRPGISTTAPVNVTSLAGTASVTTGSQPVHDRQPDSRQAARSLTTGPNYTSDCHGNHIVSGTLALGGVGAKTFTNDVTIITAGSGMKTGLRCHHLCRQPERMPVRTLPIPAPTTFSGATKTITATRPITIRQSVSLGATTLAAGGVCLNITSGLTNTGGDHQQWEAEPAIFDCLHHRRGGWTNNTGATLYALPAVTIGTGAR